MTKYFHGRKHSLELLDKKLQSKKSELIVLYGRRRVGKSRLIEEFSSKQRNTLRLDGIEKGDTPKQLEAVLEQLKEQLQDPILNSVSFKNWHDVFKYISKEFFSEKSKDKKILVIDELQWLAVEKSELVSLLKYYWDNHWKKHNAMLILCGSMASFMVDKVIKSKALYGRASSSILLKSLKPNESAQFFHNKRSEEEILKYLMLFGGIPRYLEEINLNASFNKNINQICFSPTGYLVDEFEKIFYSQFKEAQLYLRIVRLLSEKIYSLAEISKKLKISSGGGLKRYLDNLEKAEIISLYRPFGTAKNSKFKKYKLTDEYMVFYFKYIEPNLELILNKPGFKHFESLCEKEWKPWLGFAFERFCLKNAYHLADKMGFLEEVTQLGPYFERNDNRFQIDLLYKRSDKVITMCEIKYHDAPISSKIIPEFNKKVDKFKLPKGYSLEKALISIHGPDQALADTEYFHHYLKIKDLF